MAFSFLQRGNPSEYARQLSLTSYEPVLILENLSPRIDNVRHDVFLSPKFCETARQHIFKLIAKHGNVDDVAAPDVPLVLTNEDGHSLLGNSPARQLNPPARPPKPPEPADFKRLLSDLHMAALNRAKAENNVCLDLLFYLASIKFQRSELLSQYNLVLE